jgi:hypothetical protein
MINREFTNILWLMQDFDNFSVAACEHALSAMG